MIAGTEKRGTLEVLVAQPAFPSSRQAPILPWKIRIKVERPQRSAMPRS
jgi:hypothetical protein